MREADVVLTPVPQANGAIKNRPAIILREMPPYKDLLVCGISNQLHQRVPKAVIAQYSGFRWSEVHHISYNAYLVRLLLYFIRSRTAI